MTDQICALCGDQADLQVSHIIPAFVWSWLKESSVSAVRAGKTPNLRVQDGPKERLLCRECEQLFSSWEKPFAEQIFEPMHAGGATPLGLEYQGTWMLKFAVSVSWRILAYGRLRGLSHLSDPQKVDADRTFERWRQFLLDHRRHPGESEQHLQPLDVIESHTMDDLSPFINRYLTRSVDMDMPATSDNVLTYAKMGRALLIGFVIPPSDARKWENTKIHVRTGQVGATETWLPQNIYNYINDRANLLASKLASISDRQQEKIRRAFDEKPSEIAASDVFRAMQHDVMHAGDAAFEITGDGKEDRSA